MNEGLAGRECPPAITILCPGSPEGEYFNARAAWKTRSSLALEDHPLNVDHEIDLLVLRQIVAVLLRHKRADPLDAPVGLGVLLRENGKEPVADVVLMLLGFHKPPGQKFQVGHKAVVVGGLLVELNGKVIPHQVAKFLDHLGDLVDLGQIGLVHLGVDDVEGDEPGLVVGKADLQLIFDDVQSFEAKLVLGIVVPLDVPQQVVGHGDSAQEAVDGGMDMVADVDEKGIAQILAQLAFQHLHNAAGDLDMLQGNIGQERDQFLPLGLIGGYKHLVDCALRHGISDPLFVGNAPAADDLFLTQIIQSEDCIVVQDTHDDHGGSLLSRPKQKPICRVTRTPQMGLACKNNYHPAY